VSDKQTDNTVNGATADIAITERGSDFYFAICAAMGFSGFVFLALAYRKHRRDRIFHYITAAVVFVASIAYCKSTIFTVTCTGDMC
jgi:bacteriorhodopsin